MSDVQVLVLNGDGKALSVTRGLVTAGELQRSLIAAVAAFQAQVLLLNSLFVQIAQGTC